MIRIVKMHMRDEEIETFRNIFAEVYPVISTFPGCKSLCLLQDKHVPNIFFTYSVWAHESNLHAYRQSEFFGQTWNRTKSLFAFKAEAWSVEEVTPSDILPYTA
jgi:quinol monooxygenase YgiN